MGKPHTDKSNNSQQSPFYIHRNNSNISNSQIPQAPPSSNISSVGFNNLKKTTTNSSQSSTSSSSTIKTNAVTRLFSKTRSHTNVQPPPIQFNLTDNSNNSDDDLESMAVSLDSRRTTTSSKFRLSKSRLFTAKGNSNKPDLTIQTNGHHGLKVPKKILSSNQEDIHTQNGRKNSMNSPVSTLQNLFHRSHSSSLPNTEGPPGLVLNEEVPASQKISNGTRTAMTLSSNNSNSFVTDITFAMIYNFTDPGYSIDDTDIIGEHGPLSEIHKKLMIPTDQYIQNKIHKNHPSELGLGIIGDDKDEIYLNKYLVDFGKRNSKIFQNLLTLTKPLFMPSHQKPLHNGLSHTYLGCTLEDLSSYIKDSLVADNASNLQPDTSPLSPISKASKSKPKTTNFYKALSSSSISLSAEGNDDFKIRELSQDLLTYFIKCMVIYQKDFTSYDIAPKYDLEGDDLIAETLTVSWARISSLWIYFNKKIRYYLLSMFHPLQKYFHKMSTQNLTSSAESGTAIEIENTLLLAFRDIIVIPFLLQRKRTYEELTLHHNLNQDVEIEQEFLSNVESAPPSIEANLLLRKEEDILKKDFNLRHNLINCLGVIQSNTQSEPRNTDGEQYSRNEIFFNTFIWLSKIK